jgi:HAD superfamily hydrolase (TIGR01484 family)
MVEAQKVWRSGLQQSKSQQTLLSISLENSKPHILMVFTPLSRSIANDRLATIRLVATDMDGTLTQQGKFTSHLIQAFEDLAAAGIQVLIVTGRSAGWVSGLASYLPIWGAIAENGGIFYLSSTASEKLLAPIADLTLHRQQLTQMFQHLQTKFPHLQETSDNRFRLTDWTFDIANLTNIEIQEIGAICHSSGWGFTYSTVQCHIKLPQQSKAIALLQVLKQHFPDYVPTQILTVGDSPNDETLFDATHFPLSVGVANILHYRDRLNYQPAYITPSPEGTGFCELSKLLVEVTKL